MACSDSFAETTDRRHQESCRTDRSRGFRRNLQTCDGKRRDLMPPSTAVLRTQAFPAGSMRFRWRKAFVRSPRKADSSTEAFSSAVSSCATSPVISSKSASSATAPNRPASSVALACHRTSGTSVTYCGFQSLVVLASRRSGPHRHIALHRLQDSPAGGVFLIRPSVRKAESNRSTSLIDRAKPITVGQTVDRRRRNSRLRSRARRRRPADTVWPCWRSRWRARIRRQPLAQGRSRPRLPALWCRSHRRQAKRQPAAVCSRRCRIASKTVEPPIDPRAFDSNGRPRTHRRPPEPEG